MTSRDRQFLVRQRKGGTEKRGVFRVFPSRLARHRFFISLLNWAEYYVTTLSDSVACWNVRALSSVNDSSATYTYYTQCSHRQTNPLHQAVGVDHSPADHPFPIRSHSPKHPRNHQDGMTLNSISILHPFHSHMFVAACPSRNRGIGE